MSVLLFVEKKRKEKQWRGEIKILRGGEMRRESQAQVELNPIRTRK